MHVAVTFAPQTYHSELHGVDGLVDKLGVFFEKGFELSAVTYDIPRARTVLLFRGVFVGEAQQHFYAAALDFLEIRFQLRKRGSGKVRVAVFREIDVYLQERYTVGGVHSKLLVELRVGIFAATGVGFASAERYVRFSAHAARRIDNVTGVRIVRRHAPVYGIDIRGARSGVI